MLETKYNKEEEKSYRVNSKKNPDFIECVRQYNEIVLC